MTIGDRDWTPDGDWSGAGIKALRRALGLSQGDLARLLRLSDSISVRRWEMPADKAGHRAVTGPARVALSYMAQGVLDDTMRRIIPEHVMASDAEGRDMPELVLRLWWPRFVGVLGEPDLPHADGLDQAPLAEDVETLYIAYWIDDPTALSREEIDALVGRAAAAAEIYTSDSFSD